MSDSANDNDEFDTDMGTGTDDADTESDENNGDSDSDEYTPPTKDEYEALKRSESRAKEEAARRRRELKALRDKQSEGTGSESDVEKARLEGENTATAKYRAIIGKTAAKGALVAAGLKGDPNRFLKLIDLDDLDIDDDGEITGLDEQIDQMKSDYPELFPRTRAPKDRDGSDKSRSGARKPMTSTERQLAAYGL